MGPLRAAWPGLRWTGRDAWHLTLAFLGEVNEVVAGRLAPRLERAAARHPRLSLSLGGSGAFPSTARARIVWAGVEGDRKPMSGLAASVAAGARRAGAPPAEEGRRFQPHLTLARCRMPMDVGSLVTALDGYAGSTWTADQIYLIHSRLNDQPRYEVLGSWPLSAPAVQAPGT